MLIALFSCNTFLSDLILLKLIYKNALIYGLFMAYLLLKVTRCLFTNVDK
jgi:hypothetical protein